jgi:hypothetical protein
MSAMYYRAAQLGFRAGRFSQVLSANYLKTSSHLRPALVPQSTLDTFEQKRYYKNFGHKPEKTPTFTKIWYTFIITTLILSAIDHRWYIGLKKKIHKMTKLYFRVRRNFFPSVKAESEKIGENPDVDEAAEGSEDEKKKKHRKEKIGFRDRKVSRLYILSTFSIITSSDNRV